MPIISVGSAIALVGLYVILFSALTVSGRMSDLEEQQGGIRRS